jgi:ribonuclease P protein subunit RPR2
MRTRKKPDWQQEIARERIEILLNLAEKEFKKHPERSKRYVQLARKIALRYNVRMKKLKRLFCKNCFTLLTPSTSTVRLKDKTITVKCKVCNKLYIYPYKRVKR